MLESRMPSESSRRKQRRTSVAEILPHAIPWSWQALALLFYAAALSAVLSESPIHHRRPTEAADPHRIDINYGTPAELDTLPGIGPSLASAIIASRPFSSADDLSRVRGIGAALASRLRPLIKATQGRRIADRR